MKTTVILLSFFFYSHVVFGVEFYHLDPDPSSLSISGDSTLHEWKMKAKEFAAQASINSFSKDSVEVKDFELRIKSDKIKSSHAKMDTKTHQTLQSDKYPYIIFDLDKVIKINKDKGPARFHVIGKLSIAGKTRAIDVVGDISFSNEAMAISGTHEINMTDFNLEPPGFLLIKAKDKVKITFDLHLKPKRSL
jgi:polyisoprenoid-binding protein YceI